MRNGIKQHFGKWQITFDNKGKQTGNKGELIKCGCRLFRCQCSVTELGKLLYKMESKYSVLGCL